MFETTDSLTRSRIYSKCAVQETKILCFRHYTKRKWKLSREGLLKELLDEQRVNNESRWTRLLGSMDPVMPRLSLASKDVWLRWHFHVGRNDAPSASQRQSADQMTAEEKQEDGGETRCHETKASGKDVFNNSPYLFIGKQKYRRVVPNQHDCSNSEDRTKEETCLVSWSMKFL